MVQSGKSVQKWERAYRKKAGNQKGAVINLKLF